MIWLRAILDGVAESRVVLRPVAAGDSIGISRRNLLYRGPDSNRQAVKRRILSPLRLLIILAIADHQTAATGREKTVRNPARQLEFSVLHGSIRLKTGSKTTNLHESSASRSAFGVPVARTAVSSYCLPGARAFFVLRYIGAPPHRGRCHGCGTSAITHLFMETDDVNSTRTGRSGFHC
jgi:hypothetical protein